MAYSLKRDMDLIRSLLLEIEDGKISFQAISIEEADILGMDSAEALPAEEAHKLEMHLQMLVEAKLVDMERSSGGFWRIERITWNGYEFIETVRDGEVWKQTKAAAKKVGNASIGLMWELGKAYAKQMATEKLGIAIS